MRNAVLDLGSTNGVTHLRITPDPQDGTTITSENIQLLLDQSSRIGKMAEDVLGKSFVGIMRFEHCIMLYVNAAANSEDLSYLIGWIMLFTIELQPDGE